MIILIFKCFKLIKLRKFVVNLLVFKFFKFIFDVIKQKIGFLDLINGNNIE